MWCKFIQHKQAKDNIAEKWTNHGRFNCYNTYKYWVKIISIWRNLGVHFNLCCFADEKSFPEKNSDLGLKYPGIPPTCRDEMPLSISL